MKFDIDVSGEDILSKDYTICVANHDGIIRGFKFNEDLIKRLRLNKFNELYRYGKSKQQNSLFKIRLYCIAIYYIIKSIENLDSVSLKICRDFDGRSNEINSNLRYFLEEKLGVYIESISYERLSGNSNAHKYSYLMKKDTKNKLSGYVDISLKDFEEFLKK